MIFGNYKIIVRLGIIISIFLSLIFLLSLVGITTLNVMEEKLENVVKKSDIKYRLVNHMYSLAKNEQSEIDSLLIELNNEKFSMEKLRLAEEIHKKFLEALCAISRY